MVLSSCAQYRSLATQTRTVIGDLVSTFSWQVFTIVTDLRLPTESFPNCIFREIVDEKNREAPWQLVTSDLEEIHKFVVALEHATSPDELKLRYDPQTSVVPCS